MSRLPLTSALPLLAENTGFKGEVYANPDRKLYDTLGFEFSLLRLGPDAPDAAPVIAAAARHGIPLTVVDRPEAALAELYEARLALIRPDQIVAWRGDRVPEDVDKLLATVTGA